LQAKKRKRLLNQRMIIDAAVELLNERGLENLSLRQLAERLNVSAPSIYRHFADKADLLVAVLDMLFFEVLHAIPDETDPATWMETFGEAFWRKLMAVRDYGRLVLVTEIKPEQVAATVATVRARLEPLAMPTDEALNLQSSIQALLIGWASFAHAPYGGSLEQYLPIEELALRDMRRLIAAYCE
jgi:TetR/AcrR family tetracycline transcriptional repressor